MKLCNCGNYVFLFVVGYLVKYLNQIYEERKKKNTRYSLRSFARDLNISSGRLVTIMNQNELPGEVTLNKIFKHLKTSEKIKENILKDLRRARIKPKDHSFEKVLEPLQIEQMGNWQIWAVYTLMQREDYDGTAAWIAEKTFFDQEFIAKCLHSLVGIGLAQNVDEKCVRKVKNVTSGSGIPSKVLRELHKQFIQRGVDSIDNVDIRWRDISGITICMEPEKMDEARKLISDFRSKMVSLVGSEASNSELYQLSVQFFPLITKKGE